MNGVTHMGHLHTKPGEHDLMASAYIVRLDDGQPKIMVHKHRKLGRYLQFGGHVEQNENPWQAVLRELLEESGYEADQLKLLQPPYDYLSQLNTVNLHPHPICISTYPAAKGHKHTDICFAFVASEPPRNSVADDELTEVKLLTHQAFNALNDEQVFGNVRDVVEYIFTTALPEWKPVPVEK